MFIVHTTYLGGRGRRWTLFAKTDITDAFRIIQVHPSDHNLPGLSCDGAYFGLQPQYKGIAFVTTRARCSDERSCSHVNTPHLNWYTKLSAR